MKEHVWAILNQGVAEQTPVYVSYKSRGFSVSVSEHNRQYLTHQTRNFDPSVPNYYLHAAVSTYSKSPANWEKTPANLLLLCLSDIDREDIHIHKSWGTDGRYLVRIGSLEINFLSAFNVDPFTRT